ncbi:MAG: D-2-hydroxyacid dehydrogenase [Anaerolineales bacterium]|jgi:phosphoglycerate dehydrogenase-like enzyme
MDKKVEVLISLPFPEELVEPLRDTFPRLNITVHKAEKTEDIPPELWERVEVLYTNNVLPDPDKTPQLRWIQFHWAGIDSLVEAPILHESQVIATTLSGAAVSQMSEYIIMMLLALGHRLPKLVNHQRRAEWPDDRWKVFSPLELRDSVVGIVGYGSVGRHVARLAHLFGATVLATKRDVLHPEDSGYTPKGMGDPEGDYVTRLYPPQALRSMFKECDFAVVTVPLTAETRGLIGEDELAALKPTAFIIDVSRGGIIDHQALLAALRGHRIAGAALDVFPEEPLPKKSPFWELPNVLITPHISGITPRYDQRALTLFKENLHRYLEGLPLHNRFDPKRGY